VVVQALIPEQVQEPGLERPVLRLGLPD